MEQKHTPEPWKVFAKNGVVEIQNSAGYAIIGRTGFNSTRVKEKAEANARRIVACVNACAGIPVEQLEAYQAAVMRVMKERDELLAALESLVAVADNGCGEAWRQEWFDARDAIASSKGGAL